PADVLDAGAHATFGSDFVARFVGEAVGFVAGAREEEHRRGVLAELDRVLLTGEVDAVDDGAALVVLLLGERDDRELMKTEVARRGYRDGELALAAVDDEEIGELPVVVLLWLRLDIRIGRCRRVERRAPTAEP